MNEIYLEFKWRNVQTLKAQEKTEVDGKTSGKHKQVKWTTKEDWKNPGRHTSAVEGGRKNVGMGGSFKCC